MSAQEIIAELPDQYLYGTPKGVILPSVPIRPASEGGSVVENEVRDREAQSPAPEAGALP